MGPRASLDGRKISTPTSIRSRTIQPIVSRYTDRATGPTKGYVREGIVEETKYMCVSEKQPCVCVVPWKWCVEADSRMWGWVRQSCNGESRKEETSGVCAGNCDW